MRPIPSLLLLWDRHKRLAEAGVSLAFLALLPLVALFAEVSESGAPTRERTATRQLSNLVVEGASVLERHGDGGYSSFSANTVRSRKRTGAGGLIVYNDVKEIVASSVNITVRVGSDVETPLAHVFDGARHFFSLGSRGEGRDDGASSDSIVMTRVRIEKFSMRLHDSLGGNLALAAQKARLNFDSETLVLYGRVVITTPRRERLLSPRAVFSKEFDGVYLPDGHALGERRAESSAFFVLDDGGMLYEASTIPQINYDDFIEEKERLVLEHLLDALPQGLRPFLGAVLAHPGSAQ